VQFPLLIAWVAVLNQKDIASDIDIDINIDFCGPVVGCMVA